MIRTEPARLRLWIALLLALAGGLLLDAAAPSLGWWWAAFPGTAAIVAALWHQRAGVGALVGLVAGAAFWMPHISWLTLYLGPVPWLALCVVMTAWFVLFGLLGAVATRGLARWTQGSRRWLPGVVAQALTVAGLWVLREQVQGSWPYGGFAWGRLAHTQADGPLLQSVSWLGFAGLSGVLAFACALPIAIWFALRSAGRASERRDGRVRRPLLGGIGVALVVLLALGVIPAAPLDSHGTLRVAGVQGNSKSAIFDDRESGAVLQDHLDATAALLDELEASDERVDVIVWPENSAEFDLPGNSFGTYQVRQLAERAGAPILVGSILANDDGTYSNSSLVFGADGPQDVRYDKAFPVPFAEYMPNRDFFHALAPDLVDLVQLEYAAGTRSPVVPIDTDAGVIRVGLAICFDIIFDHQAAAIVADDAEVIFAQTNNADFGRTDESAQQLAIARLRAVETGRALVNISTVGTSAVVAPDGRDLDRLVPFTADALVAEVPLVGGATPALRFGAVIATLWGIVGALGTAMGAAASLRRPSSRPTDPEAQPLKVSKIFV